MTRPDRADKIAFCHHGSRRLNIFKFGVQNPGKRRLELFNWEFTTKPCAKEIVQPDDFLKGAVKIAQSVTSMYPAPRTVCRYRGCFGSCSILRLSRVI